MIEAAPVLCEVTHLRNPLPDQTLLNAKRRRCLTRLAALIVGALGMALPPGAASAAPEPNWAQCGAGFQLPARPVFDAADGDADAVHVSADEADFREDGGSTLTGSVEIQRGTLQLRADEVVYDKPAETFDANGHVKLWDDALFIGGTHARIELESDRATIEGAQFMLLDAHGRGGAAKIIIDGNELVRVRDATYTTCNPGAEDWLLVAKDIKLNRVTDVGTARHVRVEFKGFPVFYSPFLTFPLSDKRKSGFLTPRARVSGSGGAEMTVPYYFNLAPNHDATLAVRGMSDRGVQIQGEYRYLTTRGRGQLAAETIPNDPKFNGDRSALAFQHAGEFAPRWNAGVDFNWASDSTYFEDLGTNLAIASRTHLERRADLQYSGDGWAALGRVQAFQTLDRTIAPADRPYERLPQFQAWTTLPERNRRINWGLNAEAVSFDRDGSVTGTRIDLKPSVSYPIRGASAFLVPRASLRYTAYNLDGTAPGADDSPSRLTPTLSVDGGLFLERDFSLAGHSLVQTLEPRAYYLFVPFDDQSALPVFDTGEFSFNFAQLFREDRFSGADRVGDAHQLTLALTTRVLGESGDELLRASIGQVRFFRDRKVTLPGTPRAVDDSSAIVAEVAANVGGAWRLSAGIQWDPNDNRTDKNTISVRYQPDQRRVVNAAYRFVRGTIEQADVSAAWPVATNWRAVGRWNYALARNQTLESFAGIEYESCCWAFRTVIRRYLSDSRGGHTNALFLQLELKGLAGVGQRTVNFLERSIPGYENEF